MTKKAKKTVAESTETVAENTPALVVSKDSLYKTARQIEAAIAAAIVAGNTVQQEYQRIVCSTILHLATHKDIRVIRHLLATLPEGMRKKSMATFIDRFAPVSFDEEGEVHYNKERKLDLAGALAMPWWKAAKESVYIPFVFENEIQRVLDKAAKRLEKADAEKGDAVTANQVRALSDFLSSMRKPTNEKKAA